MDPAYIRGCGILVATVRSVSVVVIAVIAVAIVAVAVAVAVVVVVVRTLRAAEVVLVNIRRDLASQIGTRLLIEAKMDASVDARRGLPVLSSSCRIGRPCLDA